LVQTFENNRSSEQGEARIIMRKPFTVALLLIVPLVLLGLAGVSQAQLVLYDDFNVKPINPEKWFGRDEFSGARNTETVRKTAAKQLQLLLATFGGNSSDTGTGTGRQFLLFANPAPITTIQAGVTVKTSLAEGCPANPTSTRARATILGFFFNDGTSPAPGDATGNVFAGIQKVKDSAIGNTIEAFFGRCTSDNCFFGATLASHTFTTTWADGVADTLRVQWDEVGNQFVLAVNPGIPSEELATLPYAFPDSKPLQRFDQKDLRVNNSIANCTAGRKKASMKVLFDNVMVNP
jgi:hypothetical protein